MHNSLGPLSIFIVMYWQATTGVGCSLCAFIYALGSTNYFLRCRSFSSMLSWAIYGLWVLLPCPFFTFLIATGLYAFFPASCHFSVALHRLQQLTRRLRNRRIQPLQHRNIILIICMDIRLRLCPPWLPGQSCPRLTSGSLL